MPISSRLIWFVFASLPALLVGCHAGDLRVATGNASTGRERLVLEGEPPADPTAPIALDVFNESGSVSVYVEDHRTDVKVTARARWSRDKAEYRDEDLQDAATARWEPGPDGRAVLRVHAAQSPAAPAEMRTDLIVRLPRCDGVRVLNADGPVQLVGVGGAITVENGTMQRPGGRIEVRTAQRLEDPVALITNRGRIALLVARGGRGDLDLYSASGEAIVSTRDDRFTDVRPGKGRYRGVWNGGTNPVLARSDEGEVRMLIIDNPEGHSVADGWAELVGR